MSRLRRGVKIALIGTGLVLGTALLAGTADAAQARPLGAKWEQEIRDLVERVERATGPWPGLGTFLVAVARWESSKRDGSAPNPNACNRPCGPNSARGLYQIRPVTADLPEVTSRASRLFNPKVSTLAAAWLFYRLATRWTDEDQVADMLAVRRGWRYPRLVSDVYEEDPDSALVRDRFADMLYALGEPLEFMQQRALPPGFQWPGVDAVRKALGV